MKTFQDTGSPHVSQRTRSPRRMSLFKALRSVRIWSAIATPMLIMSVYLTLALQANTDRLLSLIVMLVFISKLPALYGYPLVEDKEAWRLPAKGFYIRFLCAIILLHWVLDQSEVKIFLSVVQNRLWDWRPLTAMSVFCAHLLYTNLRRALAFKAADLYSHLNPSEQPAAP